jgi:hypothetical protein
MRYCFLIFLVFSALFSSHAESETKIIKSYDKRMAWFVLSMGPITVISLVFAAKTWDNVKKIEKVYTQISPLAGQIQEELQTINNIFNELLTRNEN